MTGRGVVALTGATGFVGRAALDQAAVLGIPVRALVRRETEERAGVEWVRGDLADRAALAELVSGAEAVVHVAGVVNAPAPAGFEAGNVAGTLNLVEAALAARVPRFVHVSSLAAREPHLSAYGTSKRRGEQIVAASGLDWTMVRPPAVYGPRDTQMFELFRAASWGFLPVPGDGRSSLIHVEDLARLLFALIPGGEDVRSRVFEPDDGTGDGWPHHELARAIGEALGRRVRAVRLGRRALMGAARIDRLLRREKARLTPDRVNYMVHPDWVTSRAKAPPGNRWVPLIDTREGLKATAEWYRREGWL